MSAKSRPDCEELRSRLDELTEDELQDQIPASLRERLLAHASQCPECGNLLGSYRSLLSEIASLPRLKAPAEFARKVQAAILAEDHSSEPVGPGGAGIAQPSALAPSGATAGTASPASRRKLPPALLRAAALLLFAALGWLAAEHFTSRRAPPPQDLLVRGRAEAPAPPQPRGLAVPPLAPAEEPAARDEPVAEKLSLDGDARTAREEERRETIAMADRKLDALSLANEEVALKEEGKAGAAKDGGSTDLVIPLPSQDEKGLSSLLALADSFAGKPGSVEWREDSAAHQKLIVFEMDAGRAEELQASLREFQSDRYAVTQGLGAERARAPAAGGAAGPSRRASSRNFSFEKDKDARGGLVAGEGMARDGEAESKEFQANGSPAAAAAAAADPAGLPGAAPGAPVSVAAQPKSEARKNQRSDPSLRVAGAPALARRSVAGQPAEPATVNSETVPPPPAASPAPSSSEGRDLASKPMALSDKSSPKADAQSLAEAPQPRGGTLRQEVVKREADLSRQPSPDENSPLRKKGELAAAGAGGLPAAGPMPEGAPRAKEMPPATAFIAPQGAAFGSPPPPPTEEQAAGAKLGRPTPPGKVRVVIQVPLK
jgi:hypothetical protein